MNDYIFCDRYCLHFGVSEFDSLDIFSGILFKYLFPQYILHVGFEVLTALSIRKYIIAFTDWFLRRTGCALSLLCDPEV
jgi:hypothetical protein